MSNIRSVLEHYGAVFQGNKCCCLLHGEKTPSLQIYEDTESWHCFGECSEGGDAATFIMRMEDCRFPEAVRIYQEITGDGETYAPKMKLNLEDIVGQHFDKEVNEKIKEQTGVDSKGYRGIRTDTSKPFGVRYEYSQEDGSVSATYYPCTKEGQLTGYKVRKHPKDFTNPFGETGKTCDLFMQFKFMNTQSDTVVICSGEHDALATHQMLNDYMTSKGYKEVPVVSSTIGEGGLHKQLQMQYEWLNRFNKIIFLPDQDKAGMKALEEVSKVVPKRKLFVMSISEKDANDALLAGKEREVVNAYYKAREYSPVGIVGSSELPDKIMESALVEKIPLPPFMHKAQKLMAGGIPLGRIVNLGSMSGAGKSTIIDECIYYWIFNSPYKIGVVSLESESGEYGIKLLSRHVGYKIDLIETVEEKRDFLLQEHIQKKEFELFCHPDGSDRFKLVDERDGSVEDLQEQVSRLVIECECKIIILDPLQDVLDGLSTEGQAVFMKWMKGFTKSHKVTFVNINHVRKNSGGSQANSTGAELYEEDFLGSSSIFKSASCNMLFMRNKEAEDPVERNTTRMKITKCRWSGRTAPDAGRYYYCNETHRLHDLEDWMDKNPRSVDIGIDF